MAVQATHDHDAPRIDCALPLVDFDWKLKVCAALSKPVEWVLGFRGFQVVIATGLRMGEKLLGCMIRLELVVSN